MPILRYRHNALNVTLTQSEPARLGVLVYKRDGQCTYMPWRGFIDRTLAQRIPGAKPVKINVAEYKVGDEWEKDDWVKLSDRQAIQGCYINGVVFAVLDGGIPRLVLK